MSRLQLLNANADKCVLSTDEAKAVASHLMTNVPQVHIMLLARVFISCKLQFCRFCAHRRVCERFFCILSDYRGFRVVRRADVVFL